MNDLYDNLDEKRKKAGTESGKESSLRDWFGRKGAKGSKKGWVDCNAPDGKGGYKSCGRGSGESRKKYPACRPTPGACKERGKGKSWGKKGKSKKNEELQMDLEKIVREELEAVFLESHSKEDEKELEKISKELHGASKMHKGQAERIDKILDSTEDDDLKEENEVNEGMNCGCGQKPCRTYGKNNEKLKVIIKKELQEYLTEKKGSKDACYHKVKSRYKVWPSAYASGALVKCRKVGAKNWGNSKKEAVQIEEENKIVADLAELYSYEETEAYLEESLYYGLTEDEDALNEKKKKGCTPSKGKKYARRVKGKCVSYGAKGYSISPGTSKGDSYCARSYGDMKSHGKDCSGKDRSTPLCLSRQKWKCSGKYSRKGK